MISSTTGVRISTTDNLNLVCDVTKNATQLCYASLIIQIPRFDRTVLTEKMSMQWPVSRNPVVDSSIFGNLIEDQDVLAEVGAYFALVQILSWIVSGQVLATY